ncbi:MAG: hypothetical protein P1V97_39805, partial [Planctomycetota bacterium]|nr:hypothetical protein [Planctomycetota bacterium]
RLSSAKKLTSLIRPYYKGSIPKQRVIADAEAAKKTIPIELLQRAKKLIEAGSFDEAEKALESLESMGPKDSRIRALREEYEDLSRRVVNCRNKEELRRSLGEYDELLSLLRKRVDLTPRDKKLYAELDQLKRRLEERTELLEDVREKHELGYSKDARDLLEAFLKDLPGDRQCRLALSEIESYEKRVALVLESAERDKLSDPRWRLGQVQKLLKGSPRHQSLLRLQSELKEHIKGGVGGRGGFRVFVLAFAFGLGIFILTGWFHAQSVQDRSYALLQEGDWKSARDNFNDAAFFVPWFLTAEAEENLREAWLSQKAGQELPIEAGRARKGESRSDRAGIKAKEASGSGAPEKERRRR